MSQPKARPCPWCGRSGETEFHGDETGHLVCECGTEGPWGVDEADALERWNTRPVEDELLAVLSATLADLDYLRETWGDEGVMRTARDRLAAAIDAKEGAR